MEAVHHPSAVTTRNGQYILTLGKRSRTKIHSKIKGSLNRATQGKNTTPPGEKWQHGNRPRAKVQKRTKLPSDGTGNPLKSRWRNPKQCFWHSASKYGIATVCSLIICITMFYIAHLAMTVPEGESAVILFVLKLSL